MLVRNLLRKYGPELAAVLANVGVKLLSNANVYFVDSGATNASDADDGEHGNTWNQPFATIDYAVGKCTANNGDIILVAQNHAETVDSAGGLDLDVAGITIIGIGKGGERPAITIGGTGATDDVDVDAANITLKNVILNITTSDVNVMVDVNSTGFCIEDCFIEMHADEDTDKEALVGIDVNGGSANAADDFVCVNCTIHGYKGTQDGSDAGIELGEVADSVTISGCNIIGDWDDAAVHNPTGKVLTNLAVRDCYLENYASESASDVIELVSACTGVLARNLCSGGTAGGAPNSIDPGACVCFENYQCDGAGDVSGILDPAAT